MGYLWDPEKAKANYQKHGVYFADAVGIFSDDLAIEIENDHPKEQKFIILGMDAFGIIIVVVYTWQNCDIRIISARKATPKERKQYGEKRWKKNMISARAKGDLLIRLLRVKRV